jgi:hypothetical protein
VIHSFSSIRAVAYRKNVEIITRPKSSDEGDLKNIPQVKNSKDAYMGCLIYRNIPFFMSFVVVSKVVSGSPYFLIKRMPSINKKIETVRRNQEMH